MKSNIIHFFLSFACIIITHFASAQQQLPFYENWDEGSFENNDWTTASSNWFIYTDGTIDSTYATFSAQPLLTNGYESALTSSDFDATDLQFGNIWLDFEISLQDANMSGKEYLYVDIYNSNNWYVVAAFSNTGSFEWDSLHLNISQYVLSQQFKIRFRAKGDNSNDIIGWHIDNIRLFRECQKCEGLSINIDTVGYDAYTYELAWGLSVTPPEGEWIYWCNPVLDGSYGLNTNYRVAMRFDPGQLADYDNSLITKTKFGLGDLVFDSIVFKIWQGANASTLIYEQLVEDPLPNFWNELVLFEPVILDASLEWWFGFEMINPSTSAGSFGVDIGPAVEGYGNLVSVDGGDWEQLPDSLDVNWNMMIYLDYQFSKSVSLDPHGRNYDAGYNIFMSNNGTYYELLETITYEEGTTYYTYYDTIFAMGQTKCYKVGFFQSIDGDYCEVFCTALENPEEDFVCATFVEIPENNEGGTVLLYPNPASDELQIKTLEIMNQLQVYNQIGQLVVSHTDMAQSNYFLNTSNFENGMYFVKIRCGNATVSEHFVVFH